MIEREYITHERHDKESDHTSDSDYDEEDTVLARGWPRHHCNRSALYGPPKTYTLETRSRQIFENGLMRMASVDLISAINSLQYLPFRHYDIVETVADEHRVQELFWNFSYYVDVLSTESSSHTQACERGGVDGIGQLDERTLAKHGCTGDATRASRGTPILFGRLSDDGKDSTVPLTIPSAGKKVGSRHPEGFDDYEAYVFQKLGEFSVRGKEKFGCNEVISPDPSRPQDQRSWERASPEVSVVQARMESRRLQEIEKKKIQKEMEVDPEMHPSRTSFWFAPPWDKRKAPPTPPTPTGDCAAPQRSMTRQTSSKGRVMEPPLFDAPKED
ncbi:hypothetical protein N7449_007354 [Penicillium cf. viridicatum]|uniref:Uncharacterized protein n=1 Tax=Penicillium cf. viridicatum TaxID=2972119 RepID=A0A9W9JL20_9EURO|nr:hypothetical protein N7449_007354 [Penicillium cf. viridicatum]